MMIKRKKTLTEMEKMKFSILGSAVAGGLIGSASIGVVGLAVGIPIGAVAGSIAGDKKTIKKLIKEIKLKRKMKGGK